MSKLYLRLIYIKDNDREVNPTFVIQFMVDLNTKVGSNIQPFIITSSKYLETFQFTLF